MTPLEKLLFELCHVKTWENVHGKFEARLIFQAYAKRIETSVMSGFIKFLESEEK